MKEASLILFGLVIVFSACKNETAQPDCLAKNIDSTVNPADDFFDYAVGTWAKNTPIPGEESSWGIGNLVKEEIYVRLRKINEDAVEKSSAKGVEEKIGNFWYSGMDTLSIEKQGLQPLKADFDDINRYKM
jgi:putative endopeptidase